MAEKIALGFYRCGRISDLGFWVNKGDTDLAILEKAKDAQERCEQYGSCTLIKGACAVERVVQRLESLQEPVKS